MINNRNMYIAWASLSTHDKEILYRAHYRRTYNPHLWLDAGDFHKLINRGLITVNSELTDYSYTQPPRSVTHCDPGVVEITDRGDKLVRYGLENGHYTWTVWT